MDFRVNFKFKNAQTTRQQNFAHARDPPSRVDDDSATSDSIAHLHHALLSS